METLKTNETSQSFEQLKKDLQHKYAKIISEDVEKISEYVAAKAVEYFGEDFISKIDECETVKAERKQIEEDFYKSDEYKSAQKELKAAKNDEDSQNDQRLNKAVSAITTLNVTIKNRLKKHDEKISRLEDEISFIAEQGGDKLKEIADEIVSRVKTTIGEVFQSYSEELDRLRAEFGEEDDADQSFDQGSIRLEIPIFAKTILDKSKKQKTEDEGSFVKSDDNSGILN